MTKKTINQGLANKAYDRADASAAALRIGIDKYILLGTTAYACGKRLVEAFRAKKISRATVFGQALVIADALQEAFGITISSEAVEKLTDAAIAIAMESRAKAKAKK